MNIKKRKIYQQFISVSVVPAIFQNWRHMIWWQNLSQMFRRSHCVPAHYICKWQQFLKFIKYVPLPPDCTDCQIPHSQDILSHQIPPPCPASPHRRPNIDRCISSIALTQQVGKLSLLTKFIAAAFFFQQKLWKPRWKQQKHRFRYPVSRTAAEGKQKKASKRKR
jgi:hypothetical protein